MAAAAAAQELPLQGPPPIPHREGRPSGFLALIGASLLVLSVVVKPPVHAGCALSGFLLWLMGMPRLLLFGRIGLQHPVFSVAALAATTAKIAVQKVKRLFFGRQAPPEPAAAPA